MPLLHDGECDLKLVLTAFSTWTCLINYCIAIGILWLLYFYFNGSVMNCS